MSLFQETWKLNLPFLSQLRCHLFPMVNSEMGRLTLKYTSQNKYRRLVIAFIRGLAFLLSGIMSNVMSITDTGANMEFDSLGIRTVVPVNAVPHGQTQLIKITVITDVSKYITISQDEMLVAFGIQCQPDELQLGAPVTITIPHCMTLSQLDQISPILYSGHGDFGKY